ncbi:MAG: FtsX-like permease family protein [Acidobacteriota bacterium]|nr:FtsX-like permease family protein [Acidobacteriota bacterium]
MKFLPLVFRNLTRRKVRTFLTIASIFMAFVLFGVLMALRAAFTLGVEVAGADRLMMIHKVSLIQLLPKSYMERVRSMEGVTDVSHANWFGAYYQDPSNFIANMAVDPASWLRMYPEFVLPEDHKKAWIANRTGAIVGISTANKFGWKVGDRVPLISPIYRKPDGSPWEFTIDGIYDSPIKGTDKTQFFFHWDYINETFRNSPVSDQVGWYVMRVADPAASDQLAKSLDALFANSPAETKTATEKAFVSNFANQIGDIGSIMMAITAVVLSFILFVAGNSMAQSIRERTNELAVLKTLGFSERLILSLVLVESLTIAVIGGGLGLAVASVLIAQGDPTNGMLPAFYFPVRDLIIGMALVVALGLGTGLLPALQARRLKIVTALRKA